jgi:hypothetical protein
MSIRKLLTGMSADDARALAQESRQRTAALGVARRLDADANAARGRGDTAAYNAARRRALNYRQEHRLPGRPG